MRRLAPLRELQDAVENGSVTMSKARIFADVINNERASAAARDAADLTALAATLPPNQLARELERWSRSVDKRAALTPTRRCVPNGRWKSTAVAMG